MTGADLETVSPNPSKYSKPGTMYELDTACNWTSGDTSAMTPCFYLPDSAGESKKTVCGFSSYLVGWRMDEKHKKILQCNRTSLVRDLEPSDLYDGLLEKGVFTQDMIDEIKGSGTRRDQARQLVRDLETRGSRAFPLFLQCLQEAGQQSLAELLRNGIPTVHLQPAAPTQVDRPVVKPLPVTSPMDVDKQRKDNVPVHPIQRPGTTPTPSPERESMRPRPPGRVRRDSIQSYKMDASPRGHCLIINNVEFEPRSKLSNRKGSNVDCHKLERRFESLNFLVEVRTNLKQRQMKHELSALSKKDHSQYDCCVVIMLSHGAEV
ncbi:hypothetical protein F2P81_011804 [Scophthalmus maximus]|uniref:Uncharacterized protein n=1 Tax=Scophthalmus maximus TaxID=52904 RepID=A0A6A4T2N0_SCOMX|nr:hypothetical protein F2P81_011804 [Scophthalmus maximus]